MKNDILIEKIYSKRSVNRIKKKIELLGVNSKMNVSKFLNMRLILCLIIFVLLLTFSSLGFIYAPLIVIIFYISYEYLELDYKIKKRIKKLDSDALFFFEILTLSLESGRNLKGAIELTVKTIKNDLSDEFKYALEEINYGKSLNEALTSLKKRIPSPTINNVILDITQTNIFGSGIIDTLHNEINYIRDKKFLEAKSIINKMPVKISVISVLFYIPIMLLLLLGPIIIDLMK